MIMGNLKPRIFLLICIALAAFSSSCASIHRAAGPAGAGANSIDDTVRLAQEQVAYGEYQKALEIYSTAYDKYHHPSLRYHYAGTGEQIRKAADAAYQRRAFADAGSVYLVLFESGITTRDFAGSLSFNDDYLDGQIKHVPKPSPKSVS
jgi:tetratricopeptide (TPR) repeat protein